jgi:predicted Zn-ribbon and HTH transcriptional regulator
MNMAEIMLKGFRCERCEHEWIPRNENDRPTVCPKCKSPYWDKPRNKITENKISQPKIRGKKIK